MVGDLETSFEEQQAIAFGTTSFGQLRVDVPAPTSGETQTLAVTAVEKIVAPGGHLFVVGELASGLVSRAHGAMGELRASRTRRGDLLEASSRNAKLALLTAAAVGVPGLLVATFGHPAPRAEVASSACSIVDVSKPGEPCTGRITSKAGSDIPFRVSQAGTFVLTARAREGSTTSTVPTITLREAAGTLVARDLPGRAEVVLLPRDYVITVKDSLPGVTPAKVDGGLSYELRVDRSALAPTLSPLREPAPPVAPKPGITLGGPALASMDTTTHPSEPKAPRERGDGGARPPARRSKR
jgi:hypothetical protein